MKLEDGGNNSIKVQEIAKLDQYLCSIIQTRFKLISENIIKV